MVRQPDHRRHERSGAAARLEDYRTPGVPVLRQSEAPRRPFLGAENSIARRTLGVCAWTLTGSLLAFAFWEFGNFGVLIGNRPLLQPAASQGPMFRPASGSEDAGTGCTQAAIDRATGITTPGDCQT